MMKGQKQLGAGEKKEELTALEVQREQFQGTLDLIRELAVNPAVDPDKLSKILDLQERIIDKSARQQFNDAMHRAQEKMRFIATDAENTHKHNRYASYKALDAHIRPIYTKEGFSVSFDTGPGKPEYGPITEGCIRVLMDISHSGGWQIQKHTDIPVETTGSEGGKVMTKTHATGSGMSYGKRYLLIFGFNLAIGEEDDDGNKAGGTGQNGGGEHKAPTAKSDRKGGKKRGGKETKPGETAKRYPAIKRAGNDSERIGASSLTTLRANMKRMGVEETQFQEDFGFPLDQAHKGGLNDMIDWMKEASNA